MRIEVDQSGKIEQTNMDTILAFSDGISGSVRIEAKVKRRIVDALRSKGSKGSNFYLMIFCAAVFLLLKPHLKVIQQIVIDEEYTGKGKQVIGLLGKLFGAGKKFELEVDHVGKKSKAHTLALAVLRGKKKEDKKISLEELLSVV